MSSIHQDLEDEDHDAVPEAPSRRFLGLRKEHVFVIVGVLGACAVWGISHLLVGSHDGKKEADTEETPTLRPPPRPEQEPEQTGESKNGETSGQASSAAAQEAKVAQEPVGLTPLEYTKLAETAVMEGRHDDAVAFLQKGLDRTPVEDRVARAGFFARLASLAERRGQDASARIFRENAERLTQEAGVKQNALFLASAAISTGNHRGARRGLHAFMLTSAGLNEDEAFVISSARRLLALGFTEEWKSLLSSPVDRVPEPALRFEEGK